MSGAELYLNHAGTSWPKPAPVQAAVRTELQASPADWPQRFAADHSAVARALGVADPSRLLLTPGCTSALGLALADFPWRAGDCVVTSAWEHLALQRPVLALAQRGVEQVVIPPAGDAPLDLEALARCLRDRPVRLIAMSMAANVTGALLPWREVLDLARAAGARVLLDAAQTAGWIDLQLDALGADMLAFAGHKGPQAPWGVGGLYVSPELELSTPRAGGSLTMPGYCDGGSVDRLALAGLVAGLGWLAQPEQGERLSRARAIIEVIAAELESWPAVELLGPRPAEQRMATLGFRVGSWRPRELAAALHERGVQVSAGEQCAPMAHLTLGSREGEGALRISVGPGTPEDAAPHFLAVLRELLARR